MIPARVILGMIGIYCVYANFVGVLIGSSAPAYLRDALVVVGALAALASRGVVRVVVPAAISVLILGVGLVHEIGIDLGSLPKLRNYVMFPIVMACLASAEWTLAREKSQSPVAADGTRWWVSFIFYSLIVCMALEAAIYLVYPSIQGIAHSALESYSESRGVAVGLGGGLINSSRLITPLLNPVQGSFVLFTALVFLGHSRARDTLFLVSHLGTISKVTFLGYLGLVMRRVSVLGQVVLICAVVGGVFVVVSLVPVEVMETNVGSSLIHLDGFLTGLIRAVEAPFGSRVSEIGALAGSDALFVGAESFLGSYLAAFGIFGILSLLVIYGLYGSRSWLMTILFVMLAVSDNISSPHLYVIPIFYCLMTGRGARKAESTAGTVVRGYGRDHRSMLSC